MIYYTIFPFEDNELASQICYNVVHYKHIVSDLRFFSALCQLWWVDEKLTPREDELRPLFLYVQCNQNPFFKVFKVPETKGISLNDFDEIIGSFQFGVGIRQFHGVYNLVFIL